MHSIRQLIKLQEAENAPKCKIPIISEGNVDMVYINTLPFNEKIRVISKLKEEQFLSYCSSIPEKEYDSRPIHAKMSDHTMADLIDSGKGVDAFSFLNSLK